MTRTRTRTFPIAAEGLPYVGISLCLTLVSAFLFSPPVTVFLGAISLFILQFFRDPDRSGSQEDGTVLSPADGEIISIETVLEDRYLKDKAIRIAIFMNVFNVHVNRAPYSGTIRNISWTPGKFFAANAPKAALENEQNAVLLETDRGDQILFIQIAGLIARRIVFNANVGDRLVKGERCGIIKFGSRVDIYLPVGSSLPVKLNQKVKAGYTTIGILP